MEPRRGKITRAHSSARTDDAQFRHDTEPARDTEETLVAVAAPLVLVVDPNAAERRHLEELGKEQLVRVVAVATTDEALNRARLVTFDAAFIAVQPSAPERAFTLARALHALPGCAALPIAFIGNDAEVEARVEAARAGGALYLERPIDAYAFAAVMHQFTAQSRAQCMRVLVVDDDEEFGANVVAALGRERVEARALAQPACTLDALEEFEPDMVLLDVSFPEMCGFDVARMIRTSARWKDLAIVFLSGHVDARSRVTAFESGADDYLAKPVSPEELVARVRARLERRRVLREMTEKDPLTKLLSRRALLEALASRLSEARRHRRSLAIALLDLDHFKRINDTHGHVAADHVLAAVGRLLNERFRLEDLRGRWGGEEFVIVFPGGTADSAELVLSRALADLRALTFRGGGPKQPRRFHVSFSAGIAVYPVDGPDLESLLKAADARLYEAKALGRSTIVAPRVPPRWADAYGTH